MLRRNKIMCVIIVVVLCALATLALCSCVSDRFSYQDSELHAILYRSGEATILYFERNPDVGYFEAQDVVVPSEIIDNGDIYQVTTLGEQYSSRYGIVEDGYAKRLIIPATVTTINLQYFNRSDAFDCLEEIVVDEENPNYTTIDGVLYNKDCSTLLMYPPAKKETTMVIPTDLVQIEHAQYNYCNKFITDIEVEEGNEYFSVIDNALYSADAKTLVFVPAGHSENLALPDEISTIDYCALRYSNIVNLYVPKHIWKDEENDYQLIMDIVYDSRNNLSDYHPFRYVANIYFYDEELPKFLEDINLPYTEFHFGVTREMFDILA